MIVMAQQMVFGGEHKTHWVTISEDEYESMRRTIAVLQDSDLMKQLAESQKAKQEGRVSSLKEVKKRLLGT
ncbi:hypothetical protein HY546_02170 [archaeon]|nr:hypothetical protein [archaeon]